MMTNVLMNDDNMEERCTDPLVGVCLSKAKNEVREVSHAIIRNHKGQPEGGRER